MEESKLKRSVLNEQDERTMEIIKTRIRESDCIRGLVQKLKDEVYARDFIIKELKIKVFSYVKATRKTITAKEQMVNELESDISDLKQQIKILEQAQAEEALKVPSKLRAEDTKSSSTSIQPFVVKNGCP